MICPRTRSHQRVRGVKASKKSDSIKRIHRIPLALGLGKFVLQHVRVMRFAGGDGARPSVCNTLTIFKLIFTIRTPADSLPTVIGRAGGRSNIIHILNLIGFFFDLSCPTTTLLLAHFHRLSLERKIISKSHLGKSISGMFPCVCFSQPSVQRVCVQCHSPFAVNNSLHRNIAW